MKNKVQLLELFYVGSNFLILIIYNFIKRFLIGVLKFFTITILRTEND